MSVVSQVYRRITMVGFMFLSVVVGVEVSAGQNNGGDGTENRILIASQAENSSGATEGSITIVTPGNRARLYSKPNGKDGDVITKIETDSKLKILSTSNVKMPMWSVIWFKVNYKGKTGWVSEFDTDRAPDKPRGLK